MELNECNTLSSVNLERELELLLKEESITTVFQPIVVLENGSILGYEALSRGKKGSVLEFPQNLFSVAEKYNKSFEVEYLCRKKAIERSKDINDMKLFINVDPITFIDTEFKRGFTNELLDENNVDRNNIIFEITERNNINDYDEFNEAMYQYKEQGCGIALDDTGSGYSGLRMLLEVKPNYIKIDMDLIRNIHKDKYRQSLIEFLVKFSEDTNMKLIAEGIECEEELEKLMELGVYAAQGFFLGKPKENLYDIDKQAKDCIISYNMSKRTIKLT